MTIYIGIDPGLNGGIVVIDETEKVLYKQIMPTVDGNKKDYDIKGIHQMLFGFVFGPRQKYTRGNVVVILEKQYVRPVSGKRSCWMNGFGYGLLKMSINVHEYQTEIVNPQTWMKGLGISSKDGKGSVKYCLDKYPGEDWTATERSKKPHDGMTDAACIALFGKRLIRK